jgi:hypothetical protein
MGVPSRFHRTGTHQHRPAPKSEPSGTRNFRWSLFIGEVRRDVTERVGVPDDSALETVMAVQHALLPSPGRRFPIELDLPHDYALCHSEMISAKDRGHVFDWPQQIPRLRELGAGVLTIDDPQRVEGQLGPGADDGAFSNWEFTSPVSRAMPLNFG